MKAISLFSGTGPMCLGFKQAGFDVRVAVELNPQVANAYSLNSNTPVLNRSVVGLHDTELRLAGGIGRKEDVAVVFGGPPCQGFSVQGKGNPADERRSLIYEFTRIVGEVRPQHFVLENVKGLTHRNNLPMLEALIAKFDEAGYDCAPWQVINAKHYGVAQHRERLFILGSRRDRPIIKYPQPSGAMTAREAIGDLSKDCGLSGHDFVNHSAAVVERFAATAPGSKEPISRFMRLHPEGVAPTLLAGTAKGTKATGRYTGKRPIHYAEPRVCTARELARLHGLPDWWKFTGNKAQDVAGIGNSVPPPMAAAVAAEVGKAIAQSNAISAAFAA